MSRQNTGAAGAPLYGLTVSELFSAATDPAAPEWIKLSPRGRFTARDGREFVADPAILIERFQADGVAIPIDVDHATARTIAPGGKASAVGWIEELQARNDGLYGRVSWLREGLSILAARSHRYLSPAFKADAKGVAVWLHSAALVAAPALAMPALAAAQTSREGLSAMDMNAVFVALELPETATGEEVIAAILKLKNAAKAKAEEMQTAAAFQTLAVELGKDRIASIKRSHESKVEDAMRNGVLPPALRDWALNLVQTNEPAFDTFCAAVGRPMAHLFTTAFSDSQIVTASSRAATDRGYTGPASEAAKVAQNLGIDPRKLD